MPSLAQNPAAASVAAPTVLDNIDKEFNAVANSVAEGMENGASKALSILGDALGVVGAVLLNPVPLNSGEDQIVAERNKANSSAAEPEPAAGGAGKGVKGGKKDRSRQGNVDQLEGLQNLQKTQTQRGGYRISDKKSKQNIDNPNKKIKRLEDVENQ